MRARKLDFLGSMIGGAAGGVVATVAVLHFHAGMRLSPEQLVTLVAVNAVLVIAIIVLPLALRRR
jgi:hypothetical protein